VHVPRATTTVDGGRRVFRLGEPVIRLIPHFHSDDKAPTKPKVPDQFKHAQPII